MPEDLHLSVQHVVIDGNSRRLTRVTGGSQDIELFHDFDRLMPWSEDTLLDGHVLPILLYAASQGRDLKVHGPLSRGFMRNIAELLLIWKRWKPAVYKAIKIIPDRILDARRTAPAGKAISAFSGGVDATFTATRHARSLPQDIRYPLTEVLMVHGFDVELNNPHYFEQLVQRVRPVLEDLNLPLRVIRTNSKQLDLQNWEDTFALQLAGCLHMVSDDFEFGLMGSSEPYDALVFPWGSTPATDFLMSGDRMSIVHDGAAFSRTEKVAEIAKHPVACRGLKVCWAGAVQSENCGVCEKCMRTRLNFLAAGVATPPCFAGEIDARAIATIPVKNAVAFNELAGVVKYAQAHDAKGAWLDALVKKTSRWPEDSKARQARALLVHALAFLELKEPARTLYRRVFKKD